MRTSNLNAAINLLVRMPALLLPAEEDKTCLTGSADTQARESRVWEARWRWRKLQHDAPDYLGYFLNRGLPLIVNDTLQPGRNPEYELENCSFCAVGSALGMSSGAVAEKAFGSARRQDARAWGRSLRIEDQYAGMTQFLANIEPIVEIHLQMHLLPDDLAKLAGFQEFTRFIVHLWSAYKDRGDKNLVRSHYVFAERFGNSTFFLDFQTNVSPRFPPLVFQDERPCALHYGHIDRMAFWALPPER